MSGLREGCKEPYSQQAGCIISLALISLGLAADEQYFLYAAKLFLLLLRSY